jgi:hypothetical protein
LKSVSGNYRPERAFIFIYNMDEPNVFTPAWIPFWKHEDEWRGTFIMNSLPCGRYDVLLKPGDGFEWNHIRKEVVLADDKDELSKLEFVCLDEASVSNISLYPSNENIHDHTSILFLGESLQSRRIETPWGSKLYVNIADSAPLKWYVWAPGHQVAIGTQADLTRGNDGVRFIKDCRLIAGWGRTYNVLEENGRALSGINLIVDDELAATTDHEGFAVINRDAVPESVVIESPQWTISDGDIRPSALQGEVSLIMKRK